MKKLVIFDFDGVLVNTCEFWFKLHKDANDHLTWERFEEMSHGNFLDTIKEVLDGGTYNRPHRAEEKYADALHTIFSVDDILHDVILSLQNDYTLAIISSASEKLIETFIAKENLTHVFSDILGYETHASKIIKINSLLQKYALAPTEAVIITDTLGDIREANESKVSSIGVTWGLHQRETLEKGNPAKIIDNPGVLVATVKEILG